MIRLGGYPLKMADAKIWALKRWPNAAYTEELADDIRFNYTAQTKKLLPVRLALVDGELVCFFYIRQEYAPKATRENFQPFEETQEAVEFKKWMFKPPGLEELEARTHWTTTVS